ncbi:MAG: hypothetical protein WCG94_00575, partial [Methanothrix sp.]
MWSGRQRCSPPRSMQGYGRVLTAAALALVAVKEIGRAYLHQEIGPGCAGHLPGQEAEGRGTLCSLSALTNMLLRG